jgi:hypothetical protein
VKRVLLPLAGGVLGYFAESVHRRAGVWTLPNDGPMPLWVALVYALGIALLSEGFRRFPRVRARLAIEVPLLVVLFLLPPLLFRHPLVLTAIAGVYVTIRLLVARAPGDLTLALAVAAADLALEYGLVSAGLYRYWGATIPLWLAPLWAAMALSLRRVLLV